MAATLPPAIPAAASRSWLARHGALLAVCLVLILVAMVRLRVASVPLERDEGEYAYAGQLILHGIPPYQLAYNMKFPGTYYAYSLILALFGQTAWGIHVGLLIVNAATGLALFWLGRRLLGEFGAAASAVTFAVLSLDRWINGVFAHATHFVLLPAVCGLLLLLRAIESRRAWTTMGAGTLFGLAVLMKQQAIFYPPLALGLLVWMSMTSPAPDRRGLVRQAATLLAGMALPFVVLCTVLAAQGVLGRFWFWTFTYASTYASEVPLSEVPHLFAHSWDRIMRVSWPFWTMAAAGGAGVWLVRWATRTRVVLVSLLLASCLAVCPGFYFREHYFILILPSVALFTGVLAVSIEAIARRRCSHAAARALAVVAVLAAPVWYVAHEHAYLFTMSPRDVSRETYELNPFIEAVDVARYLKDHTTPDDRIAVLGSEPEIYFYANRKSATGYIYTYALMEPQPYAAQMQREMMGQIEAAHPKYVVLVPMRASWGFSPASDKTILEWTDRYVEQCYDMVGLADIYSFAETTMLWDDQVRVGGYRPRSENLIYTFRRKNDQPCTAGR